MLILPIAEGHSVKCQLNLDVCLSHTWMMFERCSGLLEKWKWQVKDFSFPPEGGGDPEQGSERRYDMMRLNSGEFLQSCHGNHVEHGLKGQLRD